MLFTVRSSTFFIGTGDLKKGFPKSAVGIKHVSLETRVEKKMLRNTDGLESLFLAGGIGDFVAL